MKQPLFTIATVCYNAENVIGKTIQSVVQQTCRDYEYLIVDGASADNTVNLISKYKSNVDKYISERDEGIYDAMNKAAKLAKGSYIYYLNAGDWFYNESVLSKFNRVIKERENLDILIGGVRRLYTNYEVINKNKLTKKGLKLGKMPCHQSIFFKLNQLKKLGYFNLRYLAAADFDLLTRAIKNNLTHDNYGVVVANVATGGYSSQKHITYKEKVQIITNHFGFFWGNLFKIKKIYIEQGIKKFLLSLKLDRVYNYVARINNEL